MSDRLQHPRRSGVREQRTPCCFRPIGAYHPSDCPSRPERWAYDPIKPSEVVAMRLVPEVEHVD